MNTTPVMIVTGKSVVASRCCSAITIPAPTIGPNESATIELSWQSNGRCERGAQVLEVTIAGASGRVEDCLQLGNDPGWDDPATASDAYGTDPTTASWRYPAN